ncbi:MAG TPA: DUF4270 domain-containing protein [Bacteroidales bacterium]|nr:DUF4270 domain-containing protein [Bacteroidales bacterium]
MPMRMMMKRDFPIYLALISALFFSSCEMEPSEIGLNLQPGSDRMDLFIDTLEVETYTVLDDSIASDERTLSPLGSYYDPLFGFVKADFFTHLRLSTANVKFSEVVNTADSLMLHLYYTGYYGDTTTPQTIRVYRVLNTDIYTDSVYYSSYRFEPTDLQELTSYEFTPHPSDSFINIKMPQSLINEFISSTNTSSFVSSDTFIDFFKGLYVTTDAVSNNGSIIYFNLISPNSKMTLYYNDSLSFNFLINASSARINMFEHDFSSADASIQQSIDNFNSPNEISYLQSLGGLRIKMFIKGLEDLDSLRYAINKAELQITINPSSGSTFAPPPALTMVAINEEGKNEFLTDYKINSTHFGGSLVSASNTYTFNIPFHIQQLILNQELLDNGIYLFPLDNRTNAGRVALNGGNHSTNSMKIIIMYSKF